MFNDILERGVEDIIVRSSLEEKLKSGRKLRIKLGIDPTSPDLHLGHAVVLRKLRAFQDLGHKAVLIIGDFTAKIGDPTGKSTTRQPLDEKTIKKNMKEYISQAGKILDIKKVEVRYNSEWLKKLSFSEIFNLAGLVSVTQTLERNDFSNRIKQGQSIRMHELFYPLMQAYDSVVVKADVELGGNDQLFNNLSGRTLMERMELIPQDVLTVSLLEGLDGKEKMSKSLNNYIGLTDSPENMYGKVMSLKDEMIWKYFMLCTTLSSTEIENIKVELANGTNPKIIKMRLAREIVALYHNKDAALKAEENFENTFKKGDMPEDASQIKSSSGSHLADLLVENKLVESRTEFSRLVKAGAISEVETGEKITDREFKIEKNINLRIGKKRFVKISVK